MLKVRSRLAIDSVADEDSLSVQIKRCVNKPNCVSPE